MTGITTLIDKQDSFEIIRDRVAQILADESASQMILAAAAGKDPELWRLNVYRERSTPWDQLKDGGNAVNVWFDSAQPDGSASNPVSEQTFNGTFNVDVVAAGISELVGDTGHQPGDLVAALNAQRIARLVRNILMSSVHTYLDLRGNAHPDVYVTQRSIQSINAFQPQTSAAAVHVLGMRLALEVKYVEVSPQYVAPGVIKYISTIIDDDGKVQAQVDVVF